MPVPFRFNTVLKVREAERERCQLALARGLQHEAELNARRDRICIERSNALLEPDASMPALTRTAEQQLLRRSYAEHLAAEIRRIDLELTETAEAVALRRTELLEADRAVKGLEKLAGRHESRQKNTEQFRAERDREDSWRAA
jgi:flagellar export protein FliJ